MTSKFVEIVPRIHRQGNCIPPSDGLILVSGLRLETHSANYVVIQTHPSRRFYVAVKFLGHYEGRGWRGFHHHATLCIAVYGFLVSERCSIPPLRGTGWIPGFRCAAPGITRRSDPQPIWNRFARPFAPVTKSAYNVMILIADSGCAVVDSQGHLGDAGSEAIVHFGEVASE